MPGRGKALQYGSDQFHRLIFACELFEFGVGPATVLALVELLWESRLSRSQESRRRRRAPSRSRAERHRDAHGRSAPHDRYVVERRPQCELLHAAKVERPHAGLDADGRG